MANFMGPMAPPQAAPQQPPQMDVKTSPTQRAQFKNFMRSMTAPQVLPNIGMGVPSPDQTMAPMPSNPMMNVDIFSQPVQYMAGGGMTSRNDALSSLLMPSPFEDGGAVTVPKTSDVRGIPHKLAYITEQEAGILKALGGTGEMHKGIPSYPPAGDAGGTGSGPGAGGSSSGSGNGGGGADNSNNGVDFGGNAFGVDGVSATGNTATDAAIGFTSSEGSGVAGPNFGGLSGASSSAVADAVSAANAVAEAGGDIGAQQNAATGVVSGGLSSDVAAASAMGTGIQGANVDVNAFNEALGALGLASENVSPVSSIVSGVAETSMMNMLNDAVAANQAQQQAQQQMNDVLSAFGYVGPTATEAQQVQAQAPDVSAVYGGYEDDPGYAADVFGVPAYSGGSFGLDGDTFGFGNMQEAGAFIEGAMAPAAFAQQMMESTPSIMGIGLNLMGENLAANQQQAIQNMLAEGAQFNQETGRLETPTASGVISMNPYGMVTYSGMPDNAYSGAFSNLVNSRPDMQGGYEAPVVKPIASDIQSEDVTQTPPNQIGGILDGGVTTPEANQQTQVTTPAVQSVVVPSTRTTSPFFMRPQATFDPSQILTAEYFQNLLTPSRPLGMQDGGSVIDAAAEQFLGSLRAA